MKNIKISIIIPVYNVEKYIKRCLDSIIAQTYSNIEIILVNDGSTDSSGEICDLYCQKDLRVKVIHKSNSGVSSARNVGIREATGDYITFCDSDDYIEKDYIEKLYNDSNDGNVDMIITGFTTLSENGKELNKIENNGIYDKQSFMENFEYLTTKKMINAVWNKMTKTEIIKKCQFDKRFKNGEDYLFNLELFKYCNTIKITDNCGYFYVVNQEGVTTKIKCKYAEESELKYWLEINKAKKEKLLDMGFSEENANRLLGKLAFSDFNICVRNITYSNLSSKQRKEKYKEILKNEEICKLLRKEYVNTKKQRIIYTIYKLKNVTILKLYSKYLKFKAR